MKKLLVAVLICCHLQAEMCKNPNAILNKCDEALSACQVLVKDQDTAIVHLKEGVKELENRLDKDTAPLVPWWGWSLVGFVIGGATILKVTR